MGRMTSSRPRSDQRRASVRERDVRASGGAFVKTTRLLGVLALFACAACDPFHTGFDDVEGAQTYSASSKKPAELKLSAAGKPVLRVMNYNVKFGGGRI